MVFSGVQRLVERISARYDAAVISARKHSLFFDHLWRAKERYNEVLAGRLAAAIAYYGFFAAFALAMVAYSVVFLVFSRNSSLVATIDDFLKQYFTTLNTGALKAQAGTIGIVGLLSLVLAGVGWVDAWRSSERALWRLDQHPGNFLVLRLVDLGTLCVLGALLAVSLAAVDGLHALFDWISNNTPSIWLTGSTYLLTVLTNSVIGLALMTVLPRLHLSPRRLLPSMLAIGVGLTFLNGLGRYFIMRTEHNPAYALVAGSVGLLVYLNFFNQIVLWATAYAATSFKGRVLDMAWGKPREPEPEPGSHPQ